jgi:hypothetical protein
LQQLFVRNCKIRITTPNDETILDDILGIERATEMVATTDLNSYENLMENQSGPVDLNNNENVVIGFNSNISNDTNRNEMV